MFMHYMLSLSFINLLILFWCSIIDTLVWTELNTSGQLLPPRAGHTTIAFGRSLFVFGGFTDAQNLYNDLHMLDIGMC